MTKNNSISIIIPCYNEEKNLKRGVLKEVYDYLSKQNYDWEVLVCNDASTDNSLAVATSLSKNYKNFKVLDLPHGGKPGAVWGGIQKAKHNWILFTDMDQSTPITELSKLIPFFDKNDIVIGSRGAQRSGNSPFRKLMAFVFLNFRRFMILPKIIDTQCGFKALKTKVGLEIFPKLSYFKEKIGSGWKVSAFDVELLYLAPKAKYKIKEVDVIWQDEDISDSKGNKANRFIKESIQMLKEIFRLKFHA
jgi:glycosyltransferase involved in cell wall biosynthesis